MDLSASVVANYKPASNIEKVLMNLSEIQAGKGLWQNQHHQYDVYGHTCAVVMAIKGILENETDTSRKNHLTASACLHDIGKPATAKKELKDGEPIQYDPQHPERTIHKFIDHERVGMRIVQELKPSTFSRLGLDQDIVRRLVAAHYTPMMGIQSMRSASTPDQFVENYVAFRHTLELQGVPMSDILELFYADRLGQGQACRDQVELFTVRNLLLGDENIKLSSVYAQMQMIHKKCTPSMIECAKVDDLLR